MDRNIYNIHHEQDLEQKEQRMAIWKEEVEKEKKKEEEEVEDIDMIIKCGSFEILLVWFK